jgi:phage FluMu gp28-like protein
MVLRPTTTTVEDAGWRWYPYQRRYLDDGARLIAVVKARQIGLTEASAALAAGEVLSRSKHDVYVVGVNFAGAKEVLWRASAWLKALKACVPGLPEIVSESSHQLVLSNRSRIIALPCKPASVRGKSGTLILDEIAHYQQDEAMWTALAPSVASNPRLRIIMISTPFGERGVFWRAVHGQLDGPSLKWSVHSIDVHKAIADGYPKDVLELRTSFTAEGWAQEFLCAFLALAGRYFSLDLIRSCYEGDEEREAASLRVLGIDVASKADTSIALDLDRHDVSERGAQTRHTYHAHSPLVLSTADERRPYPEQFKLLRERIDAGAYDRIAIDATGVGAGLADWLTSLYGARVVQVMITAQLKAKHIPAIKVDMEGAAFTLEPVPVLYTGFAAVKEQRSTANNVVYSAARDAHGHADGFSAALVAYSVAKLWPAPPSQPARSRSVKSRADRLRSL